MRLLSLKEAAYLLSMKPDQLKRKLVPYRIPHFRISPRRYRFHPEDLRRWVTERIQRNCSSR